MKTALQQFRNDKSPLLAVIALNVIAAIARNAVTASNPTLNWYHQVVNLVMIYI